MSPAVPFNLHLHGLLWGLEPLLPTCGPGHVVRREPANHELSMLLAQESDLQVMLLGRRQVVDEMVPGFLTALISSLVLWFCLGNGFADRLNGCQGTLVFGVDGKAVLLLKELVVVEMDRFNRARALPALHRYVSMILNYNNSRRACLTTGDVCHDKKK